MNDKALLGKQRREIKKVYEVFEQAYKNADALNELKAWKRLVQSNVLANNVFDVCKITEAASADMVKILSNKKLLTSIANATDTAKIQEILAKQGITSLSSETVDILKNTKSIDEVEDVLKVLSKQKELSVLARAARYVPLLDVVAYGFNVHDFFSGKQDAK
jgi:hypothetical protein